MSDSGVTFGILAYYHTFGQRQGQAEVDFTVVENIGFELDTGGGLVQVFQQLGLVNADPAEQWQHDAVGVAGEVGEEDLQVEAVFKREAGRSSATDFAVIDKDQQSVGVVFEFGNGGQQMSAQALGFVHGVAC